MILEHQVYDGSFLFVEEIETEIPAVPRLSDSELLKFFPQMMRIHRDTHHKGAANLVLATVLRPNEERIDEVELSRRLRPLRGLFLGSREALWLARNPDKTSELDPFIENGRILFPGLVMANPSCCQLSPYLHKEWGRRSLRWFDLSSREGGLSRHDWIAVNEKIIRVD